ncbi:MAG: hypothetical protein IKP72_06590, partial [Clostridia bacterium]|nr:hypothetical protein [Clostridia bacterium]
DPRKRCVSGDLFMVCRNIPNRQAPAPSRDRSVRPIPIKAALSMLGLCSEELRLPLVSLSETHRQRLRKEMASLGLL